MTKRRREEAPSSTPGHQDRTQRLSEERRRLLKALLEESNSDEEDEEGEAIGPQQPPAWNPGEGEPPLGERPPGMGSGPWGAGPGFPFGGFPGSGPSEWAAFFNNAASAASAGHGPQASPLVALKPSGSREPFFCVHAMLGAIFRYHHLALYLPEDRPFYGLQARGLDGTCEPHDRIEDMASEYVGAIRRVQPRGPYYLGGYSMGGLIAFEMAQQLVRAGERVAPVALLGTSPPPRANRSLEFWFSYMESAQRLFSNTLKAYQVPFMHGAGSQAPRLPAPLRVAIACTRAAMRYRPHSYPGALDIFATAEQLAVSRTDMTLGWQAFCTGRIELHPVEGNHLSMIEEPAVRDAARKLTECLRRDAEHEPRV